MPLVTSLVILNKTLTLRFEVCGFFKSQSWFQQQPLSTDSKHFSGEWNLVEPEEVHANDTEVKLLSLL